MNVIFNCNNASYPETHIHEFAGHIIAQQDSFQRSIRNSVQLTIDCEVCRSEHFWGFCVAVAHGWVHSEKRYNGGVDVNGSGEKRLWQTHRRVQGSLQRWITLQHLLPEAA